jgi:hypothetical protein
VHSQAPMTRSPYHQGMLTITAALLLASSLGQAPHTADLAALLEGVQTIARPGVPGPIAVHGEDAFAVVTGASGGSAHLAIVAAGTMGEGRVIVFGHGGYLGPDSLRRGETQRLFSNSLRWTTRTEAPRIGVWHAPSLVAELNEAGFSAAALDRLDGDSLTETDVVVAILSALDEKERGPLAEFVRAGGGLITAGLGWGWQQLHPRLELDRDHPGNDFLRDAGLTFGLGYIDSVDPVGDPIDSRRLELVNARRALSRLASHEEGDEPLDPEEARLLSTTVLHAIRSMPPDEDRFLTAVREVIPGSESMALPLKATDALERLALVLRHREAMGATPEEVSAAASAADFPGSVPDLAPRSAAGSPEARVHLDLSIPGWTSTGLYAPPGERLIVHAPESATTLGLFLQIGCHRDLLWGKDPWNRHPEICTRAAVEVCEVPIANPHGGLIYVDVPRGLTGDVVIEIPGAALAPLFVLGETDPTTWRERLQSPTAPWAELACSRVILTIPTEEARALDDPTELMQLWESVLGYYAELGARPLDARPQRFVTDRQISAGYMHSGYPIMTHLDAAARMVDLELLQRAEGGEWGVWHELGHNHQQPDWTFGGTVEVTCNLFTLFVIEKLSGVTPAENSRLDGARKNAIEHLASGAPFDQWKKSPFLALVMYVEIQEAFGWELYQRVFAEYAALPPAQRPKNDDEKRDQWLIRLSRAAGRDLGPFFERWGVPVSAEARAVVASLEDW